MTNKYITKATGEREEFDAQKLRGSLERSKASSETINKVLSQVEGELKDGASTKDIYTHAFSLLRQEEKPAAISYSLRKAIMDLGPTGFPFEKFVAEIFHAKGFETTTDYIARGECADHEIDIVAWNNDKLIMSEAKFHNEFGIKSDLKVVLYVKARWEDLQNSVFNFGKERKLDEGWLITNTKFSESAIQYAACKNMKLVGWNYPAQGNLQDLVEKCHLHPITCLETITPSDEKLLMESGIVLCKQAHDNPDILVQAGLSDDKIEKMMQEIKLISNYTN
jgi:hypothetical protein